MSVDGLTEVEELYGLGRIEACTRYKIGGRFPPGPCRNVLPEGADTDVGAPAKKTVKKTTVKKTIDKTVAKPKAARRPAAPRPKAAPAKAARRIDREQAAELQKRMLANNPWTASQKDALGEYSAFFYAEMNGQLRGFNVADDVYPEDVINRGIKNAVAGLRPLPEPVTVFRKVDARALLGRAVADSDERLAALGELTGKTRQEPGFSSASIRDDLKDFGNEIQLEIDVPAGTPAAFIRQLSDEPDEDEVVLVPGLRYEFTEPPRREPGGLIIMKVKASAP